MDIKTNKSLGQHWLTDSQVLGQIASYAELTENDLVIEVGPGLGTLTEKLLTSAGKVVAVEFDERLHDNLGQNRKTIFGSQADKLELVNQDILRFNFADINTDFKVVANIPYYLTSKLIRILGELVNKPEIIVLLVQKEVAERVCAGPGQMSLLSIWSQVNFVCELGVIVEAANFSPPPKVDSQVVIMRKREKSLNTAINQKLLSRVLKTSFSNKRKTLVNSLSSGLGKSKDEVTGILNELSINPMARPQELSIDQWLQLAKISEDILQ